jgi:hypothetical protein
LVRSSHSGRAAGEDRALPASEFSFVSWIPKTANILRDRAPFALHGVRFKEKIAMGAYAVNTGAAILFE